jgi:single stranded DNA-binding protein
MSKDTNIIILSGNLAGEPEIYTFGDGQTQIRLYLAMRRMIGELKQPDIEEHRRKPNIFRVVASGPQAEIDYFYLCKGAGVTVYGELRTREYTKDGQRHAVVEIVANCVVYGRGCNFERGDRHRAEIAERTGHEVRRVDELPAEALEKYVRLMSHGD